MTLSTPEDNVVLSTVCKSLGLNHLLDTVGGNQSLSILDLGPALEDNVRFWSQFSCRLYIQDFYRSYRKRKASVVPEENSVETAFGALLPFSDEAAFDIILVWDLFNYFELRELEVLVQRLGRWCRPKTRLLVLISSLPDIPLTPTVYRIIDREKISHEIPTQETKSCPRHQPRDIARLMARFTVSCSFLLRHGVQEYVFTFK